MESLYRSNSVGITYSELDGWRVWFQFIAKDSM